PGTDLVADRPAGPRRYRAKVLDLMAAYPNVYSDISWIFAYRTIHGTLKSMLSSDIGHKLMFGTDAFLVYVEGMLDILIKRMVASLSAEEREKLSWTKSARFLGL
ncbi:MAG: amidohydrolase family protein, partial [Bradymonadales bacterium]|nr:amidohydrolase family protein [Bradymonadales bacterium]